MKKLNSLISGIVICTLFSCTDTDNDSPTDNFDQQAMLSNLSENVFLPNYALLENEVADFKSKWEAFKLAKNEVNFTEMSEQFKSVYHSYQNVNYAEFGPAAEVSLRNNLNTFPTDTATIINNIESGNLTINTLGSFDQKGLPAIDYLLFSKNTNATINLFNDIKYVAYMDTLIGDINYRVKSTNNAWKNSYAGTFSNKTGSDIGSSIGILTNAWNQHYERNYRDGKIGIPVGIRSLGLPLPEKAEAYFSGISTSLAIKNLIEMEALYLGIGNDGINRSSFDDYLLAIDAQQLDSRIKTQFTAAEEALKRIESGELSEQIKNNQAAVEAAYQELQKLILLIKIEMPSRLGILITYQDNDGD